MLPKSLFMKQAITFILLLLFFASCKKDVVRGNGETVTVDRTVPSFTGIDASGNGKVDVDQMSTAFYNLQVSGNGDVSALGLQAASAKLDISGNGNASLLVRDKLEVSISGNGKVSYKGNPADVVSHISGQGTLEKL